MNHKYTPLIAALALTACSPRWSPATYVVTAAVPVVVVTQTPSPGAPVLELTATPAPTDEPPVPTPLPTVTPLPALVLVIPSAIPRLGGDVLVMPMGPTPTVPPDPRINDGYLYWHNDRTIPVFVIGMSHPYLPLKETNDDGVFNGPGSDAGAWVADGTACYARAGDRFRRVPGMEPPDPDYNGAVIEVVTGPCTGFVGWVAFAAASTHEYPPHVEPTATASGGPDG